jgi:hypothetical protein
MSTIVPDPDVTFGPFATGDVVTWTLEVPYETPDGVPVSLPDDQTPTSTLVAPDGVTVAAASAIVDDGTGTRNVLSVTLPGGPFTLPGEWAISTTLTDAGDGSTVRIPGVRFVVEDVASGWLTLAEIRQEWRDAPSLDVVLWRLLEVARVQVLAYTPEPVPVLPTPNLIAAQREQARDVWNQTKTDPASIGIGDDVLAIRPFPMSPWIKDMIRPKRAKPVIA